MFSLVNRSGLKIWNGKRVVRLFYFGKVQVTQVTGDEQSEAIIFREVMRKVD